MASSTSSPQGSFDFSSQIVSVKVGASKTEYYIHKHVLTSRSRYFHNALNGFFSEGRSNAIELAEDDEPSFKLLVNWLYTGSASTPGGPKPLPKDLFKLWILADSKVMVDLQNYCIDAIPSAIVSNWGNNKSDWANAPFVRWVWDNTRTKSRLRDFVVEMYAVCIKVSTITFAVWPPNFLIRLLKRVGDGGSEGEGPLGAYFGSTRKAKLSALDVSKFHEPTGEECEQLPSYADACSS